MATTSRTRHRGAISPVTGNVMPSDSTVATIATARLPVNNAADRCSPTAPASLGGRASAVLHQESRDIMAHTPAFAATPRLSARASIAVAATTSGLRGPVLLDRVPRQRAAVPVRRHRGGRRPGRELRHGRAGSRRVDLRPGPGNDHVRPGPHALQTSSRPRVHSLRMMPAPRGHGTVLSQSWYRPGDRYAQRREQRWIAPVARLSTEEARNVRLGTRADC
jgi:hypothetical protein